MGGQLFAANIRVLPLVVYDMVLGVDMRRLTSVLDYERPSITF